MEYTGGEEKRKTKGDDGHCLHTGRPAKSSRSKCALLFFEMAGMKMFESSHFPQECPCGAF